MRTAFILEYPWWFALFCALLAFVAAYLLYGRKPYIFREGESPWWKRSLFLLRFLAVFLAAFLLLSPLLRTKHTREEKPLVILLQDNSSSLGSAFGPFPVSGYIDKMKAFTARSSDRYELVPYLFGAGLADFSDPAFDRSETDIAAAISEAYARHDDRNIGAIILASDGIYTRGSNPVYLENGQRVPVYTICLGDTAVQKDLYVRRLQCPDIAYLGDRISIRAEIGADHLQGSQAVLEIEDMDGKTVFSKVIAINADRFTYSTEVEVPADKPGVRSYQVRLKPLPGEKTAVNNRDAAYIDVIDGRQRVLILYDAPHPDIKAVRSAIAANKNYEVSALPIQEFAKATPEYDLFILHGIPSAASAQRLSLVQDILQQGRPVLFFLSAATQLSMFNTLQTGLQISGAALNGNEVHPVFQQSFSRFVLSEAALAVYPQLPPILSPFGKYQLAAGSDVLFKQQLGKVPTDNPLVLVSEMNGRKTGVFAGEGIWRWRLHEFLQDRRTDATDELIGKLVQYLTVAADKRRFRVHTPKRIFDATETVVLDAELYNESYELVNEPDATVKVRDASGKTYDFLFDKTVNAYTLNAGLLPEGHYSALANTEYKGKVQSAETRFSVRPVNIEMLNLRADHGLLRSLSDRSGGKSYGPDAYDRLAADLEADEQIRSVLYDTLETKPLIDHKILFVLILLLLAAEWLLRKYNGLI